MAVGLIFPPPTKPWSTNEDRNLHAQERAKRIAAWKQATFVHYRNDHGKTPLGPMVVQLTIPFPKLRSRDPHNYCGTVLKAVIDGLVLAGAWPDDTPDWVGHREPILVVAQQDVVVEWSPLDIG